MNEFLSWISQILNSWKFWVVIAPWEIGVRVRMGRTASSMVPGLHLRIPFIDSITLVNTRLRIDGTPPITVKSSVRDQTRYISATIGFRIADPLKAMLNYGLPGPVVVSKAQGEIATTFDETKVLEALRTYFNQDSGIFIEFVKFVEDVEVKTYRLINGGAYVLAGHESTGPNGLANVRY